MFGFPMPDLTEIVRQVEDWKAKLERLVCAVEQIQRDQAAIKKHLGIADEVPTLPNGVDFHD